MRIRRIALALSVLALTFGAAVARAQGILQLHPLTGDLTLDYNGYSNQTIGYSGSSTKSLRESLGVRLAGDVYSPQLMSFDLALRPSLMQGRWNSPGISENGNRTALFGSGSVRFLRGGPVSLWARAHKSRDEFNGRFGQRTISESDGFNFGANFRSPYLNASVSYMENESDAVWSSPSTPPTRRVRDRSQLLLNVTNSKTRIRFDRLEVHDLLRQSAFLRYRTLATNRQRWGKGSSLNSRLTYTDQQGVGAVQSFLWGQNAHLQHTELISTDLRYSLTDINSTGDHIKGWNAGFNELVRLSPRLAFMLGGSGNRQTATVGSVTNWRIQPRVNANTMLPAGIRFSVGAGVGYRWRIQDTGEGGTRTIVGEPHVVPPAGRFLLDELDPNPTTVRLTNEDGSILYDPGADYRLFESGAFLEVIVLAGGRIAIGESLLADYEHTVLGSSRAELLTWSYSLSAEVKGLQLYHSLVSDNRVKSTNPLDPYAGENRNVIAGIRFQSATPIGALTLNGEWRETSLGQETTELYLADAGLSFLISQRWRGSAGAGWSTRRDGIRYDLYRAYGRVSWTATRTVQAYADLSANAWERIDSSERYIGGSIGADWNVGLLTVGARLERSHLDSGPQRVRTRLSIRASRRF
jgi:hypothetical protein